MVNKDVALLFGEDVRIKVEELLDASLSEEEMKKAFSTTSKEIAEELLQEANNVRNGIQEEAFRDTLLLTVTNQILRMISTLYKAEEGKDPSTRRRIIKYTAIDSLTTSEISMQAISAYRELKELEKGKEK